MESKHTDPNLRHDFMLLFDVVDGNANGDPDAGNLPRVDPETMQGIVTDVCLKRKIRDYVFHTYSKNDPCYDVYVKHRGILAKEQAKAYEELKLEPGIKPNDDARKWMCNRYYDVRMFGAVMTTGKTGRKDKSNRDLQWNCGQVRGPVQLTFARTVDMVFPWDISITRVALTNAEDTKRGSADDEEASSGQMGRKSIIPYGLFVGYGFINPFLGKDTGLTRKDLKVFWEALQNMWEYDRSASRGMMSCRGIYIFTHESPLGNAPAHKLFDCIKVERVKNDAPARSFSDYRVTVEEAMIPKGVELTVLD